MPQDSLFFRVLRRFNILWIALLGLSIIAAVGYHLYKDVYLHHRSVVGFVTPPQDIPFAPAGVDALVPDNFGSADTRYGPWDSELFVLSRTAPPPDFKSPDAFKGYEPVHVVNLLVFDTKTGVGSWLFPTSNQVIGSRDAVYEGAGKVASTAMSDPRPVIGMVLVTNALDSKGHRISGNTTLYLWTKGAAAATKLLAADDVLSYGQSGADRYVVVYKKGKETRAATYAIPGFKLLYEKVVPAVPK